MDAQKVDMYIMLNAKFFDSAAVPEIRERLLALPEEKWVQLQTLSLKDPTLCLIISLLAGNLGVDRFYLGDTGMGIGKLLTCGGMGIWAIVDWFLIMGAAREKNLQSLLAILY